MSNRIIKKKKTSSKLKPFVLQRTPARKWKDNPQNGIKYLQIIYQEIPGVTGKFWPWSTEWSRAKANRVLPRECTGYSKHHLPTIQEKTIRMDITRWSIPKSRLIIFFAAKDGEALYSQQKQDQELTVAQIMNPLLPNSDLKKVGKTTRPFRYDLNQICYDYTVEVRNRFKGLDLIDRVPDGLWTEVRDIVQETGIKTIPKKKKYKKAKWLSEVPWK